MSTINRSQVKQKNFSYKITEEENYILIPYDQQMVVYQEHSILDQGELDIEGELIIID